MWSPSKKMKNGQNGCIIKMAHDVKTSLRIVYCGNS